MKTMIRKYLIGISFIALALFVGSCGDDCKECFFIEEANGNRSEFPMGEFCDDDIEVVENELRVCSTGNCFNECR